MISRILHTNWKRRYYLSNESKHIIREKLTSDYYLIVTRKSNFISTYLIVLAHFLLTGRRGFYSHILMNVENDVHSDSDFMLVEAITTGVKYSTFNEVFNQVDAVGLIKPKHLTIDEWTVILDKARLQVGKPYDTLFDLRNDKALSCVELIRVALQNEPNYERNFSNFERMIKKYGNLTPQMFVECQDFEVVWTAFNE